MSTSELKVLYLVKEIGVYNKTLNNYLNTFNIEYKSSKYLLNPNVYDLRDYHLITKEFYNFIISQKESICEYEEDYYKWKSIKYISKKINVDITKVLNYFNNLDLEDIKSFNFSRQVYNGYVKVNKIKYPIGNLISGFPTDFQNGWFILEKKQELFSLYQNKTLFTESRELYQLSSYEVDKGILEMD